MKKLIGIVLLSLIFTASGYAASKTYTKNCLTGGSTNCIDSIDGDSLSTGDRALIITDDASYSYYLDAASGASENSPFVISPDSNSGNKRWVLKSPSSIDLSFYGSNFVTAIAALGSTETTLYIKTVPIALTAATTIPDNISVVWEQGCVLPSSSYTLTINGTLNAGAYQLFTGPVVLTGLAEKMFPEWFDDTGVITQDALTCASSVGHMHLSGNTYTITTALSASANRLKITGNLATITGTNIAGYMITFGDGTQQYGFVEVDGVKFVSAGTTHGIINVRGINHFKSRNCDYSGVGVALEISASFLSSINGCKIRGEFTKGVHLTADAALSLKSNSFELRNSWVHLEKTEATGIGLHVDDATTDVLSEHNYYENILGRAIYVESSPSFKSENDAFEDCVIGLETLNTGTEMVSVFIHPDVGILFKSATDRNRVTIPSVINLPTTVAEISGDYNYIDIPASMFARVTDTGTDNILMSSAEGTISTGDLTLTAGTVASKSKQYVVNDVATGASITLAWGFNRMITLSVNVTSITFPTPATANDGEEVIISFRQAGGSDYTVAGWPASVLLPGGAFTMSTGTNPVDTLTFVYLADLGKFAPVSIVQDAL